MHSQPLVTSPITIFFIVLAIIVLAPVLLNRLRIPHIVGMIVAGVIVGPYGFNILADDSSFVIFGQVGLLYLMFLAGLEIDMYHLKLNFKKGMFFGAMTFLLPIVLGVIVSFYLLRLSILTSFLLGAMYAAHTLISYPVAARFGVTKSSSVLIAVVGTIFAVVGALLVLAAVTDIADTGKFEALGFAWLLFKIVVYAALVVIIYPWATRLFLRQHSDRVTQFVFILALVLLSAWMAELIGLSGVLGAFLAGLVLNKYVPSTSPLMSRIEFVGNSIFIPYFLISVGMMVNLHLLANKETIIISLIMLAVAIFSKWLAAKISGAFYRMSRSESNMMFGLTTAHTAVALAVVTIGYTTFLSDGQRMLDERILNATILVILVTCGLAPIITANASSRLRLEMLEYENNQKHEVVDEKHARTRNMLVPVTNPITAPGLMELALLLADHKEKRNGVNTYVLHVRNDNNNKSRSVGNDSLELAAKVASAVDVIIHPVHRFDINPITGITNFIKERDIDTVVLGMHHKATVVDSFLGSKLEQLMTQTRQMLVVSRCYVPVNTLTRIIVYVAPNSHLEAGFNHWLATVAKLGSEMSCRVLFYCPSEIESAIKQTSRKLNLNMESDFHPVNSHDDYVIMANRLMDEDLFIWIASRPDSVSWSKEQAEFQDFIANYLQLTNLLIIYPQISIEQRSVRSFATPFE